MGQPIANSSNIGRGWRNKRRSPTPQSGGEVKTMRMGKMKSDKAGCCYPTGNKYRGGHDDGSRKSRSKAGGMTKKHHSRHTHA